MTDSNPHRGDVIALAQKIRQISVDDIDESTALLRTSYAEEPLLELGDSMISDGLLQPIMVQPSEDGKTYELVIGSRRLKSARLKNAESISAVVIERKAPLELLIIALNENMHRADLTPFEEAAAFMRLMHEFSLPLKIVAARTKKTESYISTRLALMSMPEEVMKLVATRQLGLQFVKPLARVASGADQTRIAQGAVANKLTLAEMQAQVRREREEPELQRALPDSMTPDKVRAKIDVFQQWIKKAPPKVEVGKMNADERTALQKACLMLEAQVRSFREFIGTVRVEKKAPPAVMNSNFASARNHRDVWPSGHINRILAPDRPSDEVLAKELGRTIVAIKVQRSLHKK